MSYQVLARKWRPQTFSDVVGQEHVLTALANGLSLGRIHHAYLLSGTRGVGKTTIARLLAKGLNCETGITATPCGVCVNCREIEQGRFVDLIEIDAASRTKVEDTRDLLDNVQYAPARGRFKVYLIDEVHMLSRHSFNALLKTLEEPPAHVKFLLATTDPQKLPVTILSRCLQFHLKALDVSQIRGQLEHILQAEQIPGEARALQLLARAADGSMRDALSLTDQAIASGLGSVTTEAVSQMLGSLNSEQPLALIEALVAADGNAMMAQLAESASRGVDWESLLVEMLTLLHRIAMGQLLPDALGEEEEEGAILPRLRDLARQIPPGDLQLYYQTLLVGRKELAYAPDKRMGIEMTLLRALAFHPSMVADAPPGKSAAVASGSGASAPSASQSAAAPAAAPARPAPGPAARAPAERRADIRAPARQNSAATPQAAARPAARSRSDSPVVSGRAAHIESPPDASGAHAAIPPATADDYDYPGAADDADDDPGAGFADPGLSADSPAPSAAPVGTDTPPAGALPDATTQLLQARSALLQRQESQKPKKGEPALTPVRQKQAPTALERLASVGERAQQRQQSGNQDKAALKPVKPEAYRWKASVQPQPVSEPVTTPKALRSALEHEKTPELVIRLAAESIERDAWAAQVQRLNIPKLVQQLALNAYKEDLAPGKICLHLRSSQRHLNSSASQQALTEALSEDLGAPVELTVVADDNPAIRTPLEWRQAIYEEKLIQARQAITADNNIQTLRRFFDAELDEDSIRPV